MKMIIPGILLLVNSVVAIAQPAQPPAHHGAAPQPSGVPGAAPRPTSSNPWVSLPEMSLDRCTADDVGTGPDPKTGGAVRVNVDPQSGEAGNIVCPPRQPSTKTKPPR
jgi:hypothetical protein